MSSLDSEQVRQMWNQFGVSLRGYRQADVTEYLGRLALVVEAVGDRAALAEELPEWSHPLAVRAHEFPVVWRGFSRAEVRDYLNVIADDLDTAKN